MYKAVQRRSRVYNCRGQMCIKESRGWRIKELRAAHIKVYKGQKKKLWQELRSIVVQSLKRTRAAIDKNSGSYSFDGTNKCGVLLQRITIVG